MLFIKANRGNYLIPKLPSNRPDEVPLGFAVEDSIFGYVCSGLVTIELLIRPPFEPLVLQFMSEQQALPQNIREWLAAVDGCVDYVIEKC
jgi:hypothetical protein